MEDGNFETGFRRMTMEEELADLDRVFQSVADRVDVKEMISGEFNRLSSKAGSRQTVFADTNKKLQGTDVPQKLITLTQAWKNAYKVSGSKEDGMEKVLSMVNGMFSISVSFSYTSFQAYGYLCLELQKRHWYSCIHGI